MISYQSLLLIHDDNPLNVMRRCNAILLKWLEVDTNASWRKLLNATDKCTEQCDDQGFTEWTPC